MKLKILLVSSLILLILTLGAVSAQDNSTDDIAQGEDGDILEKTVSGNTFKDIQTTVSSCNEGDTVELNGKYTSSGSPISISKSITIDGNGSTLDAGKKSSILKVTSKSLTLKNINFANSKGVAITSNMCNLLIINCTFTNGGGKLSYDKYEALYFADCDYAGINAKNGQLTLINSTFSANSIAGLGCSVALENGKLTAQNTKFLNHNLDYDNLASPATVVYLLKSKSRFDNCTFKDNAVPALHTQDYMIVKNSYFDNNYEGIFFFGNTEGKITSNNVLDVYNSTFTKTKNNAFILSWEVLLNIEGCNFTENKGSIIDSESQVNINNSQFTKNSAKNGAVFSCLKNATITNSKFTANTAERGSIVYNYEYLGYGEKIDSVLTIINSTIEDSLASVEGGAIYATCTNIRLVNTNISTQKNSKGSQIYLKASTFNSVNSTHEPIKVEIFKFKALYSTISSTTFDSGKRFEVTISEKFEDGYMVMSYVKAMFKVYTGKKFKIYYYDASKESRPYAFFRITSELSVGKHKIEIMPNGKYYTFPKKTFTLTIKKAKTTVKAKKMTAKYKKSKYFKVTIKNKASGKVVEKLKVKIKVYTGKKYKSYTLKTNKNGEVKLNTKKLKWGTHKVVITSNSKNYIVSKKSSIKIK